MRVLAVADVYEALTAERPYRAACGSERALEIIRAEAPHSLDSDAIAALQTLVEGRGMLASRAAPITADPSRDTG
jgi:HD-GYP domain-containing protein (c-di-GMP phosphodiesterase class II)